jgi:thioredoxin 1
MTHPLIQTVTDADFDDRVLKTQSVFLVDFWAEWCGPCKMIAPILDEIAPQYEGRVIIAKINVDQNQHIPARFGVRGIPTLMLFKGGQIAATKVGALNKTQLVAFLDSHVVSSGSPSDSAQDEPSGT